MGRAPCCQKIGLKRGRWTSQEDEILIKYIQANGEGSWKSLPKNAGLLRCGKSCRLRWINYLRGDLKRGNFTQQEEEMIVKLHTTFGNRWSIIASHLPGRTDNEIKNHWNSHLSRQIYRFITNKIDKTQTSIDIATVVNQKKPRIGRVSRCVAKKYNSNKVSNNSQSTPQFTANKSAVPMTMTTAVDNQIDHQNVEGICTISVTKSIKENLVCNVNDISEEMGWNGLGLQDDELIDINYFLDSEAMDSTEQIEVTENMKNNNEWNIDEKEDQNLHRFNCSETKGLGFNETEWDMGFGFDHENIDMFYEGDDMLVWLWEDGNP